MTKTVAQDYYTVGRIQTQVLRYVQALDLNSRKKKSWEIDSLLGTVFSELQRNFSLGNKEIKLIENHFWEKLEDEAPYNELVERLNKYCVEWHEAAQMALYSINFLLDNIETRMGVL